MIMSFTDIVMRKLSTHTSFFGLPLWVLIISLIAFFVVLIVGILSLYYIFCRRRRKYCRDSNLSCIAIPVASKHRHYDSHSMSSLDRRLLSRHIHETEMSSRRYLENHAVFSDHDVESFAMYLPGAKEVWRGSRFSLRDIEMATNGLAKTNMIGSGDYGAVYRGILLDNTPVAVKKLVSVR